MWIKEHARPNRELLLGIEAANHNPAVIPGASHVHSPTLPLGGLEPAEHTHGHGVGLYRFFFGRSV